jgi:hypothetical protein
VEVPTHPDARQELTVPCVKGSAHQDRGGHGAPRAFTALVGLPDGPPSAAPDTSLRFPPPQDPYTDNGP